jgi:hypothetical protein
MTGMLGRTRMVTRVTLTAILTVGLNERRLLFLFTDMYQGRLSSPLYANLEISLHIYMEL